MDDIMKIDFKHEAFRTFMVVTSGSSECDPYEEKMLSNQIPVRLLPFEVFKQDNSKVYKYDITGRISLASYFRSRQANADNIRAIICGIYEMCHTVDEYLLDMDSVLLSSEYIYTDADLKQVYFASVPGYEGNFRESLTAFSRELLEHADHSEKACVLLVYEFFRLVKQEDFSIQDLQKLLIKRDITIEQQDSEQKREEDTKSFEFTFAEEVSEQDEKRSAYCDDPGAADARSKKSFGTRTGIMAAVFIMGCIVVYAAGRSGALAAAARMAGIKVDIRILQVLIMGMSGALILLISRLLFKNDKADAEEYLIRQDCGTAESKQLNKNNTSPNNMYNMGKLDEETYTTLLTDENDENQTTILRSADEGCLLIYRNGNGTDDINISCFPCVLGSTPGEGKYVVNARGISRRHAEIDYDNGVFYITDLGSTNGTYVNGIKLSSGERFIIETDDELVLAAESFLFRTRSGLV